MRIAVLASAIILMVCGAARAGNEGIYVGVKGSSVQINLDDASHPAAYGGLIGYNFGNGPAMELEYNKSETINIGTGYGSHYAYYGSLDIQTIALYFTYRSQGPVFFKARAGILQEEVSSDRALDADERDTGLSVGVGAGVNLGSVVQLEGEYTYVEQDVSLLSLGLNLRF